MFLIHDFHKKNIDLTILYSQFYHAYLIIQLMRQIHNRKNLFYANQTKIIRAEIHAYMYGDKIADSFRKNRKFFFGTHFE